MLSSTKGQWSSSKSWLLRLKRMLLTVNHFKSVLLIIKTIVNNIFALRCALIHRITHFISFDCLVVESNFTTLLKYIKNQKTLLHMTRFSCWRRKQMTGRDKLCFDSEQNQMPEGKTKLVPFHDVLSGTHLKKCSFHNEVELHLYHHFYMMCCVKLLDWVQDVLSAFF